MSRWHWVSQMSQARRLEGVGVDGRSAVRRRDKTKHKRPLPYPVKIAAVLIGIVGLVILCAVAYTRISQPYEHQAMQKAQIGSLQAQLDGVNSANDLLERRIAALDTQEGVETAARSQRYVEPGEILLNVQASPAPNTAPALDESFGARLKRAWDGLTGRSAVEN